LRVTGFVRVTRQTSNDNHVNQDLGDDQEVERDETDPYNEVIFGRRMPDSIAVDWNGKVPYVLDFKRTSGQRHTYRERGESRARAQHDVLVQELQVTTFQSILIEVASSTTAGEGVKVRNHQIEVEV